MTTNLGTRTATHRFTAHDDLLISVMREQAGTLAKAVLEGAMNSIDAGASCIRIIVTDTTVEIHDDGNGFASEEAILNCFRVFGLPQEAQERMSKTYGHFRMGRGQMFHYGRNVWTTNTFSMHTDLDAMGLDFDVQTGIDPAQPGCHIRIELYDRHHMLPSEIGDVEREIAHAVRYAPCEIVLNGRRISRDPAKEKWDLETEDAWIRFRESGTLDIYNQGVFVEGKSHVELGTAGTIVSKHRLQVNFARNMVMTGECAAWRRIRAKVRETTEHRIRTRKVPLTAAQRDMVARRIANGEQIAGAADMQLITDVTRVDWTLTKLTRHCKRHRIVQVLVSDGLDPRAEILQNEGRALVIHTTTLERFGCEDLDQLLAILRGANLWPRNLLRPGTFDEQSLQVETDYRLVPREKVTPLERITLELIQLTHPWWLLHQGWRDETTHERQILLGESPHALAWTDGSSYIAIDRRFLGDLGTLEGWFRLALLLAAQYSTETDTSGAYEHGPDFYLRFFKLATTRCPAFAAHAAAEYPKRLRTLGRQVSKRILGLEDRIVKLERDWEATQETTAKEANALKLLDQLAAQARRSGKPN